MPVDLETVMPNFLSELAAKDTMQVIGLMSGTSADAVDAALCEVSGRGRGQLKVKLLEFHSEAYSEHLRNRILDVSEPKHGVTDALCKLNYHIGDTFARAAERLIEKAKLKPRDIDVIGSHGQTVAHLPPRDDTGLGLTGRTQRYGSTLQIGESAMIAERLRVPVVSNFRARDMAAGGQGAPLVPYVDYLTFSSDAHSRAVINIGGISNMTYLPKQGADKDTLAFDSGPGNMIIDALIQRMTQGKQKYDQDGAWAKQGQVDGYILSELLKHPFLQLKPPKSTGREEFGLDYANYIYDWGVQRGVKPKDVLRTATDFTAIALADAYQRLLLPHGQVDEIIVAGGGTLNPVLMARMRKEFGQVKISPADDYGMPVQAKEAMAFAVLARETVLLRPGNLPSATGADGPRILGQITPP